MQDGTQAKLSRTHALFGAKAERRQSEGIMFADPQMPNIPTWHKDAVWKGISAKHLPKAKEPDL